MSNSGQTLLQFEEIDYPFGGIGADNWIQLSPDLPSHWTAISLLDENQPLLSCFLGAGHTQLFDHFGIADTVSVFVNFGFVYLTLNTDSLLTAPGILGGYSQILENDDLVVLTNYSELLVVEGSGTVRYEREAAIDELNVKTASRGELLCEGMFQYGSSIGRKVIEVADISQVHFELIESPLSLSSRSSISCFRPKRPGSS